MPHDLILHPTRMFKLQLFVDGKRRYEKVFEKEFRQMETKPFVWLQESVCYTNNLNANSTFTHSIRISPHVGEIKAILGYYLIKPQIAERIGLRNKADTTFHILLQKCMTPNPQGEICKRSW